jgi:hypothetical protein
VQDFNLFDFNRISLLTASFMPAILRAHINDPHPRSEDPDDEYARQLAAL